MLYGNEFQYNDVNLNLNYAGWDLSQRKNNENYCTAAAVLLKKKKAYV